MATHYSPKIPDPQSLFDIIDASNSRHTSGSGNILSGVRGISWSRISTVTDTIEDGVKCFNMDNGYLETSGSGLYGQYYTIFYLWKPRTSDTAGSGWRTLHRNDNDHVAIVLSGGKSLGMYSNRSGGFRDSGYDIEINWQTLIVTGEGDSSTATTGTSTFYVNGQNVGTSDRVTCGTDLYRIGWSGQSPGKIAVAGSYNKKLTLDEISSLDKALRARL